MYNVCMHVRGCNFCTYVLMYVCMCAIDVLYTYIKSYACMDICPGVVSAFVCVVYVLCGLYACFVCAVCMWCMCPVELVIFKKANMIMRMSIEKI